MGSRISETEHGRVYKAASAWVDRALRHDDSLFTPGVPIWSLNSLQELRKRFLDQPDNSNASFLDKLRRQLANISPEIYQLMGEALYFHFLIVSTKNSANEKGVIETVLNWSPFPVSIPPDLAAALTPGIASPGQSFHSNRPFQVGFLVEFAEQWKEMDYDEQEHLLDNPWSFKKIATQLDFRSQLLKGSGYRYWTQLEALLHLVFPDTFEAVVSGDHKRRIAKAFSSFAMQPTEDVDRKLEQIRHHLEGDLGRGFHFYDDEMVAKWNPNRLQDPWDKLVAQAKAGIDSGRLEEEEINYKVRISRQLAEAREAMLEGSTGWSEMLNRGMIGNIIHPIQLAKFRDWVDKQPEDVLVALKTLWTKDDLPIADRISTFINLFPSSATGTRGAGTRMNVVSQLLMAVAVEDYPPFRITFFDGLYKGVGYNLPPKDADEATLYEHALGFLDKFIGEADNRGLKLRHRLDAQSVLWMIQGVIKGEVEEEDIDDPGNGRELPNVVETDLTTLARDTYLTEEFLREIVDLLEDKKQVIFQGPPGTGKTYVAQVLAECLGGSPERVTLVQFHPSYAYEDFVQGFRPKPQPNGQPGFELQDGPLLRAAKAAQEDDGRKHFLVIDEINRGNLAKVFGELYFLLEYRNKPMDLQYSNTSFSLPENLYIIGTMNTADRSIALVDLALRRRFHFVEFHPDDEPVRGVLRRYLSANARGMVELAEIVERANEILKEDRDAAIGPSYFMKPGLTEEQTNRIWKHNVLPYVKELLYGRNEDLKRFELDSLRRRTPSAGNGTDDDETGPPADPPPGEEGS